MAFLEIANIRKSFDQTTVVHQFDLAIEQGEFVSFLGPSGCGKTTILRMVAGFETPTAGSIRIAGKDVTHLRANQRNVGMVFQAYALFPNMTVADNVAFGMKVAKRPVSEIKSRVEEMLQLIKLPHLAGRYPYQLSGGQQQRVALARALAGKPQVLLLDEPLSALDAKIRISLREEIRSLQRKLGITTIFVTHDQEEALTLSDRIAIFNAGSIVQAGSPGEVYARPVNRFAAGFLGEANFLSGQVAAVDTGWAQVALETGSRVTVEAQGLQVGQAALLTVRPERLAIHPSNDTSPGDNRLGGTVGEVIFSGNSTSYRVQCGGQTISVFRQNDGQPILASGTPVSLTWEPDDAVLVAE